MALEDVTDIRRIRRNIDARVVTSVVVGMATFGAIAWGLSKVKALRPAVKVAKGG